MQYYLRKIAPLSLRVSTIILCALKVLQPGHISAVSKHFRNIGVSNIRIFLETALVKSRHPSSFRLNPLCLSGFQG